MTAALPDGMPATRQPLAGGAAPAPTTSPASANAPHRTLLHRLIQTVAQAGGSDLLLTAGLRPTMKVDATLQPIGDRPLTGSDVDQLVRVPISDAQWDAFAASGDLNFGYSHPEFVGRVRGNLMRQGGQTAATFRYLRPDVPSADELRLPPAILKLADLEEGFVLVAGGTSSGKSSTAAVILDHINATKARHIVTLEDPIEYVHKHKKSVVHQREVGLDTPTYEAGVENALRQAPDVILVGEMRTPRTIRAALTAAKTGHLVISTLHSQTRAEETIARILGQVPSDEQQQVREDLAACLKAVAGQALLPRIGGGRQVAVDLMVVNQAISAQIRQGQMHQIQNAIHTASDQGMQTMDTHLVQLVKDQHVRYADALPHVRNRDDFNDRVGHRAHAAGTSSMAIS